MYSGFWFQRDSSQGVERHFLHPSHDTQKATALEFSGDPMQIPLIAPFYRVSHETLTSRPVTRMKQN
jgi:hypothetical protein